MEYEKARQMVIKLHEELANMTSPFILIGDFSVARESLLYLGTVVGADGDWGVQATIRNSQSGTAFTKVCWGGIEQ